MSYRTVLIENNRMMLERLSSVIRNSRASSCRRGIRPRAMLWGRCRHSVRI